MKKSIILSAVGVLALSLASCDDFLNDNRYPMDTQVSNDTYWSTEGNVQMQCDNLYQNMIGYATGTSGLFYFQTLNDNQGSGVGGAFTNWKNTNVPTGADAWSTPYTQIRHCNEIITGMQTSTLDESKRNNYEGIARLIRAQQYYKLVRCYGDVPYLDKVPNVTETELIYQPRMDRDIVMDNVYADLDFAAKNITGGSSRTWSANLAYAMMSEICLYEGTYCKYRTAAENYKAADPARAKTYLERAAAAAATVINSGKYSLNGSYQANYNSTSLASNPEMIFCKEYKSSVLTHSLINYLTSTTVIAGISKDAFDSFLFKDGKPLALTSMNKSDVGYMKKGVVAGTGPDATIGDILYIGDLLDVRDARLAATVDTVVAYGTRDNGLVWARYGSSQLSSSTGYLVRKYDNVTIPWTYRQGSNYTWAPIYWLAVVMCDYAEAKAELGTLSDADLNMTLNKLFNRAGLPDDQTVASLSNMNDPANNMGISSLLWEVRRCRRCETMMDNELRYWDLIRWHQLDKLDTTKYPNIRLGANIGDVATAPQLPGQQMSGKYLKGMPGDDRIFEARQYLYPIPSNQLTLTKLPGTPDDAPSILTQNELWK